ncbi:MAG: diguanylate cyclase [Gammaproteobacteria bacterium]|nr:diguanylate cyclase [Gammaproteobacteria bacterium]MDH3561599.1 diguanylate cyclase [Gammaproteobacteria bacterium]
MKALVIEDSKIHQQMIGLVLEALEVDVHLVSSAEEGLAALGNETFDLISLDLHLPDMDGLELCRRLRTNEATHLVPIVLLTSEDAEATLKMAYGAGVTEVMRKTSIEELQQSYTFLVNRLRRIYNGRVLYVEDSPTTAQLTINTLNEMGLEVDHCCSGEAALEAFGKQDYDVVVTDVVLEGELSGLNVVRGIRSAGADKREIPVLAVSGHEDMSRRVEILRSGANDYIEKPIVEDEFKARLGNLITSKQLFDQVRSQQDELRKLAVTDQLTGLYNRTYLAETAQKYVSSSIRHRESLSLLMLDLDKFKDINDSHGHAMGDRVLAAIGDMLLSRCREEDVVARFGGEEFIILLPRCDLENAIYKAEHLCQFIHELHPAGLAISASFGVSSIHQGGRHIDFEKLLKEADTALYTAKHNGRNRVEVYSEAGLEASA